MKSVLHRCPWPRCALPGPPELCSSAEHDVLLAARPPPPAGTAQRACPAWPAAAPTAPLRRRELRHCARTRHTHTAQIRVALLLSNTGCIVDFWSELLTWVFLRWLYCAFSKRSLCVFLLWDGFPWGFLKSYFTVFVSVAVPWQVSFPSVLRMLVLTLLCNLGCVVRCLLYGDHTAGFGGSIFFSAFKSPDIFLQVFSLPP